MLLGKETAARRSCEVKPYVSVFGNVCVQRYTSSTNAIDFFQTTKSRYDWTMGLTEHCICVGCPVGTLAECDVRHSGLWISQSGSGEWPVLGAALGRLFCFLVLEGGNQDGKSGVERAFCSSVGRCDCGLALDFVVWWVLVGMLTSLILGMRQDFVSKSAAQFYPRGLKGVGAVPDGTRLVCWCLPRTYVRG
jgi:hypothetical protein